MSVRPKVSIIVPIYNVERYLVRCMESLLNQTLREIEIIMVDDGSPDKCPELCDQYAAIDSRIKVIHKQNEGLGYARNTGLTMATGEYVAYIDSDDFIETNMFERLYATAIRNNCQVVFCGFNIYDNSKQNIIRSIHETPETRIFPTKTECEAFLMGMLSSYNKTRITDYEMSVWHAIYKLDIIREHRIEFCSERIVMSEDILYNIDFLSYTDRMAIIPDQLYNYCINPNSLSNQYRKDRFEKVKLLFTEIINHLSARDINFPLDTISNILALNVRFCMSSCAKSLTAVRDKEEAIKLFSVISHDPMIKQYIYPNIKRYPVRYKLLFSLLKLQAYKPLLFLLRKY